MKKSPRNASSIIIWVIAGLIIAFLIFPVIVIIPMAFSSANYLTFPPPGFSTQWWREFFSRPDWTTATINSFKVAILCTIISTILGTAASFTLVRKKFRGKNLVYTVLLSPMIIPSIIWAVSVYFFFAPMHLVGSWVAIALNHVVAAMPFVVIVISGNLKSFDINLEHAAATLGAGKLTTFFRITFPLIKPGLLTAALFSFMTSFDELLIALYLSGQTARTLPRRMWDGLRYEINPTIPVASTFLICLTLLILLAIMLSRKSGKKFQ